jgi:hypothetical protein
MTSREHTAQRDLVRSSLAADELRETHRAVYPLRAPYAGRGAVQTMRYRPRLLLAAVRIYVRARPGQRWS